jgi:hypothetical protein
MQSRPYKADRAKTGYALTKQASAMDTGGPLLAAARTALGARPEAIAGWPGQRGQQSPCTATDLAGR